MAPRMSRRVKTAAYVTLAAALIGVGWWVQAGLSPLSVDGVVSGIAALFWTGAVLTGVGVMCRRGAEKGFFLGVGGGTLLAWAVTFVLFGGMDNVTASGADTAANTLMLLWTGLPLAGLICASVSVSALKREDTPVCGRVFWWLTAALWLWMSILVLTGQFLGFVHL